MARRYFLDTDTGVIRGMTDDDSFVHTDPAMVAVVIYPRTLLAVFRLAATGT